MQKPHFPHLLAAVDEEESLESCDRLTRGEVKLEELEAQQAGASARIQALREMSKPMSADLRKQLGDILERSNGAPLPVAKVAAPIPLRARTKRSRYTPHIGIGLALAAGIAAVMVPKMFRDAGLPDFSIETAEHDTQVLGGPAVATRGTVHAKKGSCLELTLRPKSGYHREIKAQAFLIPKAGGDPVLWQTALYQTESGTLRQEGNCAPLPRSAEVGDWRIVVAYGNDLPAQLQGILAHAPKDSAAQGKGWATAEQLLQITN